jgi:S-DNA-T family DNA segregation ATPase FtsK/SpoIIIE
MSRAMSPVGRNRAVGGTRRAEYPVRLNIARVHVPLTVFLFGWLARQLGRLLAWIATRTFGAVVRRPWLLIVPVVLLAVARLSHGHTLAASAGLGLLVIAGLAVWWWRWRESFTRHVAWTMRGAWRCRVVYGFGWQPAMATTGLGVNLDGAEYLPRLLRVSSTGHVDRVWVRMLPGQVFDDWAAQGERLAQTFGAQDCRVRTTKIRHRLELWFLTDDPLTEPVTPASWDDEDRSGADVDLGRVQVGLCEDGTPYRLRLLGTHVLAVGATGSGKGSVIWSTLQALAPAIRDGLVSVWCLDPKGGMELAPGRALFARFVYGDPDDNAAAATYEHEFAAVLEDAVAVMRRRQAILRGHSRLHTPTVDEPLVLVVVDEIASLTAYVVDRDAKKRIAVALSLLLSQGRAVGVSVLGAVQDPRKEVLTVRDLFPTRVALRLTEADHVGLVLGQGARDRGARCDHIPEDLPGVGYVGLEGIAEPVRIRFTHVTDDHIAALCHTFAPRPRVRAATAAASDTLTLTSQRPAA